MPLLFSCLVVSNSLQPHGLSPTRLLCPWDFSGKNTGMDCHFLPQGIFPIQGSNPHLLKSPALASGLFTTSATCWPAGSLPLAPPFTSLHFSSVSQSCPTLCDRMNRSMPGLSVHHHLPEFTQTHVHRVGDAIQPSHPPSSPSSPAPNPSQHQSLFQ